MYVYMCVCDREKEDICVYGIAARVRLVLAPSIRDLRCAGIRFIDFRTWYTAPANATADAPHDWFGLHFMQTQSRSIEYLAAARGWLDAHPTEVSVVCVCCVLACVCAYACVCVRARMCVYVCASFAYMCACLCVCMLCMSTRLVALHGVERRDNYAVCASRGARAQVIVVWVSKHGVACGDEFSNVSAAVRGAYWAQIEAAFDGLLFNGAARSLNETTIGAMLAANERVVLFVEEAPVFSNGSSYALDSCGIHNDWQGDDVTQEVASMRWMLSSFAHAAAARAGFKATNTFYLMGMMAQAPALQILYAALLALLPGDAGVTAACAGLFNMTGFAYCPAHLIEVSALTNYYNQIALDTLANRVVVFVYKVSHNQDLLTVG
jgi:hypothetical protein